MSSEMPKSVLITGCSAGGIGDAMARSFANRGYYVFATARNPSKIAPELSSIANVTVIALDTTFQPSIDAAVAVVSEATGGTLDYLINNAGSGMVCPFLDCSLEDGRKLFDVNFWGVLSCIQSFQKLVIKAKGTIVNMSSIGSEAPVPYDSVYGASKAAVSHFTRTIALELEPLGVNVINVFAGLVQTSFYENVPQVELPKNSIYQPVLRNFHRAIHGENHKEVGMSVGEFGERVVPQILSAKLGKNEIWEGTSSTLTWAVSCLPRWVMDKIMYDRGGLKNLQGANPTL